MCFDWLTVTNICLHANRSHVRHEFTNTKKLIEKLARIGESSIFSNRLPTCLSTVFGPLTHTNLSLPTLVCCVKAALEVVHEKMK